MIKKLLSATGQYIFWITYPGIFILIRNSHRTRVIISVDKKILFVKGWLSGDKKLGLPGGGIRSKETSIQAAVREIEEETGITLDPNKLDLIINNLSVKEHGIKYIVDCYEVKLPEIVATSSKSLEIISSTWLDASESQKTGQLSEMTIQLLQTWLSKQHLVD